MPKDPIQINAPQQQAQPASSTAPVLDFILDPQTSFVLDQIFKQHTAHGRSAKTATQSINDATDTKLVWESNTLASEITWNAANNRFVILRAGTYLVSASVLFTSPAAGGVYELLIYKNGAEYSRSASQAGAATNPVAATITDSLALSKGDYIEIYALHSSGLAKSTAGSANLCYFNIIRSS